MNKIRVVKVLDSRQMKQFVRFPETLYSDCKQYVPDLETDVYDMFNPKKNPALEFASVQAFLALDGEQVVGRIAGIINPKANGVWNTKYVRFGLIEFIDDIEVSRALIDAVSEWGRERGMSSIQGPMGITDFDKEGMLITDFDEIGSMNEIYNYDYYPRHMEILGFEKEADWVHIRVDVPEQTPEKYQRVAKLARERYGLHVRKVTASELRNGYGRKFFHLMNEAYAPLFGFSPFSDAQIDDVVNRYLSVVDLDLVPMIEDSEGNLISAAVTTGSMSEAFRKSKGRLFPFGWFHLLRALKWKRSEKVEMMLIAVRPDYQNHGVNAMLFADLIPVFNRKGFRVAETAPQLELNHKELDQWKHLNPQYLKRRRCWVKSL